MPITKNLCDCSGGREPSQMPSFSMVPKIIYYLSAFSLLIGAQSQVVSSIVGPMKPFESRWLNPSHMNLTCFGLKWSSCESLPPVDSGGRMLGADYTVALVVEGWSGGRRWVSLQRGKWTYHTTTLSLSLQCRYVPWSGPLRTHWGKALGCGDCQACVGNQYHMRVLNPHWGNGIVNANT